MKILNEQGVVFGLLPESEREEMRSAVKNLGGKAYYFDGVWKYIERPSWAHYSTYKVEVPEPAIPNKEIEDAQAAMNCQGEGPTMIRCHDCGEAIDGKSKAKIVCADGCQNVSDKEPPKKKLSEQPWANPSAKFRSVDENGNGFEYQNEPFIDGQEWENKRGQWWKVGYDFDSSEWQKSMEEREPKAPKNRRDPIIEFRSEDGDFLASYGNCEDIDQASRLDIAIKDALSLNGHKEFLIGSSEDFRKEALRGDQWSEEEIKKFERNDVPEDLGNNCPYGSLIDVVNWMLGKHREQK